MEAIEELNAESMRSQLQMTVMYSAPMPFRRARADATQLHRGNEVHMRVRAEGRVPRPPFTLNRADTLQASSLRRA